MGRKIGGIIIIKNGPNNRFPETTVLGAKVPESECSEERKFHGAKVPGTGSDRSRE